MRFDKNFATKEQMKRLNKLFIFVGNVMICEESFISESGNLIRSQYAVTFDCPLEILYKCKCLYPSADLTAILDELPHTVGVEFENGELENYYVSIDHYNHMITYSTPGDTDVLKVFTGDTLIDAAVDAIEWIYSKRNDIH